MAITLESAHTINQVSYHFVSTWRLNAPIDQVWAALTNPTQWPKWWSGLKSINHTTDQANGIGTKSQLIWRAPFGYRLSFETTITEARPPALLAFTAVGDLVGQGRCQLTTPKPNLTIVTITWDVATTKPWMNRWAWFLRPIFTFNHRLLMSAGERGLARFLMSTGKQ